MSKTTAASWKARKTHEVTLPSGTKVTIQIPNLPALIKAGRLSNDLLIQAAEIEGRSSTPTVEEIMEQHEFVKSLIAVTVVEPAITVEEVDDTIPVPDQEMLIAFAMRQTDMDAVYHQLGGLETMNSFREVRGL